MIILLQVHEKTFDLPAVLSSDYSMTLKVLFGLGMNNFLRRHSARGIQLTISVFGVNTDHTFLRMNNVE